MENNIYQISGRVKNLIAMEDIALSPVGIVLVNYYSLALKDLYDFSETLPVADRERFEALLKSKENLPMLVIKVGAALQEEWMLRQEQERERQEELQRKLDLEEQENSLLIEETPHGLEAFEDEDESL